MCVSMVRPDQLESKDFMCPALFHADGVSEAEAIPFFESNFIHKFVCPIVAESSVEDSGKLHFLCAVLAQIVSHVDLLQVGAASAALVKSLQETQHLLQACASSIGECRPHMTICQKALDTIGLSGCTPWHRVVAVLATTNFVAHLKQVRLDSAVLDLIIPEVNKAIQDLDRLDLADLETRCRVIEAASGIVLRHQCVAPAGPVVVVGWVGGCWWCG